MERLTKKELRALLECIKECYPICDLETFSQRVVSRLSKIVATEIISYRGVNPRRKSRATYPIHSHYENKIVQQRPTIIHPRKTGVFRQGSRVKQHNRLNRRLDVRYRMAPRLNKHAALDCKGKEFAPRKKFLFNMLSPYLTQAYRNAQTITHMQQKLMLVDQALYRLNLGLIFLTPDGRIRLATTWAMQQITRYLGLQPLRKNRLPERLWTWVKQQEVIPTGKDDVLLRRSPLVLERDGKRLVIRLVSDFDQNILMLEERPTMMQLQSLVPIGLSPREAQVLDWVAQGKTNKEIGVILELSPRTVQKHLEHIYRKIYVESRTAAAAKAYELASLANNQIGIFSSSLVA